MCVGKKLALYWEFNEDIMIHSGNFNDRYESGVHEQSGAWFVSTKNLTRCDGKGRLASRTWRGVGCPLQGSREMGTGKEGVGARGGCSGMHALQCSACAPAREQTNQDQPPRRGTAPESWGRSDTWMASGKPKIGKLHLVPGNDLRSG